MAYLERYLQGDHAQVWDELLALGPEVFQDTLYPEALAVVQETMRRVRQNIEGLIPRLIQIGYVFGYDHLVCEELRKWPATIDWADYIAVLRWTREQPPVFLPAQLDEEYHAKLSALGLGEGGVQLAGDKPAPDMKAHIQEINRLAGPLPLAIRVWYEQVGAVNLYGYHPAWVHYVPPELEDQHGRYLMDYCDPLQICALDEVHTKRLLATWHQRGRTQLEFAPDPHFKNYTAGSSTPYAISLAQGGVDGMLAGYPPVTFVQYLRTCFRWAGFPGMAKWPSVPNEDLAFLTENLIPF